MNNYQTIFFKFFILILSIGYLNSSNLGGYYQSWSAKWAGSEKDHTLSQIPSYISYILIAFANPSMKYVSGSNTFRGTGLDFSSDFKVVKAAIALAKKIKLIKNLFYLLEELLMHGKALIILI